MAINRSISYRELSWNGTPLFWFLIPGPAERKLAHLID